MEIAVRFFGIHIPSLPDSRPALDHLLVSNLKLLVIGQLLLSLVGIHGELSGVFDRGMRRVAVEVHVVPTRGIHLGQLIGAVVAGSGTEFACAGFEGIEGLVLVILCANSFNFCCDYCVLNRRNIKQKAK